jgi:hypothetical protein
MRKALVLLIALCSVFGMFASPASAVPSGSEVVDVCFSTDAGTGPCLIQQVETGTGNDLHVSIANRCRMKTCTIEVTLLGSFNGVVIDRANECTDGATCSLIVHMQADIRVLQFRDKAFTYVIDNPTGPNSIADRCDATSVCVKTPDAGATGPAMDTGSLVDCTGSGPENDCFTFFAPVGTGQDLNMILANRCSGQITCTNEVTLQGSFNRVVIDRANQCTKHATCYIIVHMEAQIRYLQFRDKTIRTQFAAAPFVDRCDATSVCIKTP